eukprot:jgi/Botrbrau1/4829/Bobra.0325s0042.3
MELSCLVPSLGKSYIFVVIFSALLIERKFGVVHRFISVGFSACIASVLDKYLRTRACFLSLLEGKVSLSNIEINPKFLDSFNLPFACRDVRIETITLLLPRWSAKPGEVTLEINGVTVEATSRSFPEAISEYQYETRLKSQTQRNRQAKLQLLDAILFGRKAAASPRLPFLRKAVVWAALQIAHGAYLKITDVHIKLSAACNGTHENANFTQNSMAGHKDDIQEVAAVLVTVGEVIVSFCLKPEPQTPRPGFLTVQSICKLHGMNLSTCSGNWKGESQVLVPIVQRWNASCTVEWTSQVLGFMPVNGSQSKIHLSAFAHALLLTLDPECTKELLQLLSCIIQYYKFFRFREHRPQVSVVRAPQLWWRHAGHAVLREISERKADQAGRLKISFKERSRYIAQYQEHIRWSNRPRIFLWFPQYLLHRHSLLKAEEYLDISQIAVCRWWALARLTCPNAKSAKKNLPEQIPRLLDAVMRIANLNATSLQRHASARANLAVELSCPKIAVSLLGSYPFHPGDDALHMAVESLTAKLHLKEERGQANMLDLQISSSRLLITFDGDARGPWALTVPQASELAIREQPPIVMCPNHRGLRGTGAEVPGGQLRDAHALYSWSAEAICFGGRQ